MAERTLIFIRLKSCHLTSVTNFQYIHSINVFCIQFYTHLHKFQWIKLNIQTSQHVEVEKTYSLSVLNL